MSWATGAPLEASVPYQANMPSFNLVLPIDCVSSTIILYTLGRPVAESVIVYTHKSSLIMAQPDWNGNVSCQAFLALCSQVGFFLIHLACVSHGEV